MMKSSVEVAWAEFFDKNRIKWLYEPVKFKRYTPDFWLYERNLFVEVKSLNILGGNSWLSCDQELIVLFGKPNELSEARYFGRENTAHERENTHIDGWQQIINFILFGRR